MRAGAPPSVLIDALISSDEYQDMMRREHRQAVLPRDPDTFSFHVRELVEIAYRGVFRRDPEPAGYELYSNAIRNGLAMHVFIDELAKMPEARACRGLVPMAEQPGVRVATAEMNRLATSIEHAVLTLAMGAVTGPGAGADFGSGASARLSPPRTPPVTVLSHTAKRQR